MTSADTKSLVERLRSYPVADDGVTLISGAVLHEAADLIEALTAAMWEVRETLLVHAEEHRLGQITSLEFHEVVAKAAAYLDKRLAALKGET
jgi:hypothetical protein